MAEAEDRRPGSLLERAAMQLKQKQAQDAPSRDEDKSAGTADDASAGEEERRARRRRLLERAAEQLRLQQASDADEEHRADEAVKKGQAAPADPADQVASTEKPGEEQPASGIRPAAVRAAARQGATKRSRYQELDVDRLRRLGFITPDAAPGTTSEEFRIIKRPILLNAFAKGKHRIPNGNLVLVTSCRPGDGKTFCTINLALSIALEQDVRVLLIDADFPKPEALRTLGITASKGLMDAVLDPDIDLADCMIRTNVRNLTVLPAGRQHNLTPELLTSERMGNLLTEISRRYPDRIVLFDSAPVLASSIASALSMHTGQAAFVVEAERTTEQQIREALNMIASCKHIGFILNKVRFLGPDRRFGAYYGYAYGR
ncbi:MAG: tyrosine-protein kinase family protein [Alphaproteobacteria bacterium]|nr:MAG: tyrosine-protein kinase family protein [Alphaproteobacteria bacterium]